MSKTKETPRLTRGQRNNNPGNIRYNKSNRWQGLIGKDNKGFCRFSSIEYGVRALCLLILRYIEHGYDTPRRIILRYAPLSENDSYAYVRFVCNKVDLHHDSVVEPLSCEFFQLISAIMMYESKVDMSSSSVEDIYNFFFMVL